MLPARKTVSKKTLHEDHSSKTFELRLLLVIYLLYSFYMGKKFQWQLWNLKNGDSQDDIFHTLKKTKNFKRIISYYESFTLKLIRVKGKESTARGLQLFFTFL